MPTAAAFDSGSLLALAFGAGVASSLSPCVVALLPILVGYIGAYSQGSKTVLWRSLLLFVLGFALVLTAFGLLAGGFGILMTSLLGRWWSFLMGLLAVLMGLQLMGWLKLPLPQIQSQMPESAKTASWIAPLILGAFFAAASSPCATPFLTAVLAFTSQQKQWGVSAMALLLYALGQSALLLLVGFFTGLLKRMALLRRVGFVVVKLSAGVFILAGLRLLALSLGWFDPLAFYP